MAQDQKHAQGRETRAFVLRIAPSRIDRVREALATNTIIIGWSQLPQLLDPNLSYDQFRQIIHDRCHPTDTDYQKSGSDAGKMWRFIREMDNGDLVVVPHRD